MANMKKTLKKTIDLTGTTRKKMRVIGTQNYVNVQTQEVETMSVVQIEERDANFHKLWLRHIITTLEIIGNQKIKFAFWLIENMNRDNQVTMTMRQMSAKSGISLQTVQRTVAALLDCNFLKRENQGVYSVNPDIVFKGGKTDRLNLLFKYSHIGDDKEDKKDTDEVESCCVT